MIRETSAGGLVHRDGKFLMVRVRTLDGKEVWTFPKGHLDPGETTLDAALREVTEETGYACRALGPLMTARYSFMRSKGRVSKTVKWYSMEPEKKVGRPDAAEVLSSRWMGAAAAARALTYPSDVKLLETFLQKGKRP
jgi:8-oxo-dGTP pyrophosphatase MutT (NUDIX family)